MMSILLKINDVVDGVDRTGHQTECNEGNHNLRNQMGIMPGMAEQQAGEHECVLHPLVGAERPDEPADAPEDRAVAARGRGRRRATGHAPETAAQEELLS